MGLNKINNMKKTLVYLFLVLICLSYVFAGTSYKLDFSEEDTLLFGLEEKDRIEFELNEGTHTIILDKVKEDKIDLDVFLFIDRKEKQTPFYVTINNKKTLRLDLDKDGNSDLLIGLAKTFGNKAELIFKKPTDVVDNQITGQTISNIPKSKNYTGFIGVLIGLIVILCVFLIVWNKK